MNRSVIFLGIQFIILTLSQVFIFDHMGVSQYDFIPYGYLLFILLFPVDINKNTFLFLSFLLGLSLDLFSSTGGAHTVACTVISFIRPAILKFSFGTSYEFHTIRFTNTDFGARLSYFAILIALHHIVLFLLESFDFSFISYSLQHILFSSLYSLSLCLLLVSLFSTTKR